MRELPSETIETGQSGTVKEPWPYANVSVSLGERVIKRYAADDKGNIEIDVPQLLTEQETLSLDTVLTLQASLDDKVATETVRVPRDVTRPIYEAKVKEAEAKRQAAIREAEAKKEAERQARNADLLVAAGNGDAAAVREKLDQGAEVNSVHANGVTALILAAEHGHREVVALLLERGADAKATDQEGRDALLLAAYKGHVPVVQLLLDKGGDVNRSDANSSSPLILASEEGHADMVTLLLARGASVKAKDREDRTALIVAAGKGHLAVVKVLLDRGSPREAKDKSGYTALMVAAINGHAPVVQALLDEGADALATTPDGDTALRLAQQRGQTKVAQVLKPIETKRRTLAERAPVPPVKPPHAALLPSGLNLGRYHALVIGNNAYRSLEKLETAVADAESVGNLLRDAYGYAVTTLTNATRDEIISAFDYLRAHLGKDENLLVYYAGHGQLDKESDRGYWLPVDADPKSRARWVSNTDVTDALKGIAAKHVILVVDSCYSGTLTRGDQRGVAIAPQAPDYVKTLSQKRTRTVLTSGALEPVTDRGGGGHSVFARAFLDTLRDNASVMDGTQVFARVREQVRLNAAQTPLYANIQFAGHEPGGDFLFVIRGK